MKALSKQSGMALLAILMLIMASGAFLIWRGTPILQSIASIDESEQKLVKHRTERLMSSLSAYYQSTCNVGGVTQKDLSDAGYLENTVNLPQVTDIKLFIEKTGYSAAAVIDMAAPSDMAVLAEIMPLGAEKTGNRVRYVRTVLDRKTPMQKMIMADNTLYSNQHC